MISLGIDLGGSSAKLGIVEDGAIVASAQIPTRQNSDYRQILDDLADASKRLMRGFTVEKAGIGSPGLIDTRTGRVCFSNNIRWSNAPLRDDLGRLLGLPVSIANDAKCAALGEAVCGAGKGYRRVVMLTLGTGVGGGAVTDGKLAGGSIYEDASDIFGHMTVVPNGRPCTCGRNGCLEAYCSARAVAERGESVLGVKSAKEVFERAAAGDIKAGWIVDTFTEYLSIALTSLANILRPQRIVIGGGLSAAAKQFLPAVNEVVQREAFGAEFAPVEVVAAKLGNRAGIIGASLL